MVIVAPLPMLTEVVPLSASTAGLLETHVTVRPERVAPFASFGAAVNTCAAPTTIGVVGAESVTAATAAGDAGLTVITTLAVFPPADALIVTPPTLSAVTK